MLHLLPDLRPGAFLVRARIRFVGKLVDVVRAMPARKPRRHVLVVLGMAFGHIRTGELYFSAHRFQVEDLLLAHLVGHDDEQPITLLCRDQREAEAGVARRRLDDERAGPDFPSRSAASIMASATRSLIDPPGFWFSSLRKRRQRPTASRRTSTSGVLPIKSSI